MNETIRCQITAPRTAELEFCDEDVQERDQDTELLDRVRAEICR